MWKQVGQVIEEALQRVHERGAHGPVMYASSMWTIDSQLCAMLGHRRVCALMGGRAVLPGLSPNVLVTLAELGIALDAGTWASLEATT